MERTLDAASARRQFGTLLDEVFHKGDTVIIARKGKALARLVPVQEQESPDTELSPRRTELLKKLHSLPALAMERNPVEVLRNLRKQKRSCILLTNMAAGEQTTE